MRHFEHESTRFIILKLCSTPFRNFSRNCALRLLPKRNVWNAFQKQSKCVLRNTAHILQEMIWAVTMRTIGRSVKHNIEDFCAHQERKEAVAEDLRRKPKIPAFCWDLFQNDTDKMCTTMSPQISACCSLTRRRWYQSLRAVPTAQYNLMTRIKTSPCRAAFYKQYLSLDNSNILAFSACWYDC